MSTIHFDKLSMHARQAEPVSLGIPFPQGALTDPARLGLRNGDTPVPVQTTVTARWPDGSIKWLMTHFQVDLPGDQAHTITFTDDGSIAHPTPDPSVTVSETATGLVLDTGTLRVVCAPSGQDLFHQVALDGCELFGPGTFSGFTLVDVDGNRFSTGDAERLTVLESGPIRGLVELSGRHTGDHGSLFDYRILLEVWAGKPYVRLDYQFINRESTPFVQLAETGLRFVSKATGKARCALGQGYYRTSVHQGPGRQLLDAETIVFQGVEHVLETFYGDFWADWGDDRGGVCITPYQAHQNLPKSLQVDASGIDVGILPAGQEPLKVLQGVAKTHRLQFCFHGPEWQTDDAVVQSLQFQYPDIGMLPEAWYRRSQVWEDLFPPTRHPAFETRIIDTADHRARGLGMLHWGDGPDQGYTQQGRGKGDLVWTNNEYDFPHAMFLLFAKSGERRFRDVGCVAAQHWIDVDFCHHSDDPLKTGGQPIHTAGHVTGSVTPSHEWTEGLLDYYHLTGKREARDKAISIADNMLRQLEAPKFSQVGGFAARETGWAMRGLIAVYEETGEGRYLEACRRIAAQFLEWKHTMGAFLAPYTSHTRIRVPFMIAIAVNALYRYYLTTADERIPGLIVEEMRDLLDHCVMPDGRFFYKELPSLHRRAGGPREMEALCHAYNLSGETRFLDQVLLMARAMLRQSGGGRSGGKRIVKDMVGDTVLFDGPSPKAFASFYVPFMVVYRTLAEAGMLDKLDAQ